MVYDCDHIGCWTLSASKKNKISSRSSSSRKVKKPGRSANELCRVLRMSAPRSRTPKGCTCLLLREGATWGVKW